MIHKILLVFCWACFPALAQTLPAAQELETAATKTTDSPTCRPTQDRESKIESTIPNPSNRFLSKAESLTPVPAESSTIPQNDPGQAGQTADRTVPNEGDQQALAEIAAIRARLGGGVASQLSDLFDRPSSLKPMTQAESQSDFEQELKRLVSDPHIAPATGPLTNGPKINGPIEFGQNAIAQTEVRNGWPTQPNGQKLDQTVLPVDSIQSLAAPLRMRAAARHLEMAAEELESVAAYQLADELRRTANRLWRTARRPANPSLPAFAE